MTKSTPMPTRVLHPSRGKKIRLMLVSAAFVAVGLAMLKTNFLMAMLTIVFFGLGVVVSLVMLVPGCSQLELRADGFVVLHFWRRSSYAWTDIRQFDVLTLRQHGMQTYEMVAIDFTEGFPRHRIGRLLSSTLTGADGGLPDTYGLRASELAELMSQYQLAALAANNGTR
jgi:hypothetical protein